MRRRSFRKVRCTSLPLRGIWIPRTPATALLYTGMELWPPQPMPPAPSPPPSTPRLGTEIVKRLTNDVVLILRSLQPSPTVEVEVMVSLPTLDLKPDRTSVMQSLATECTRLCLSHTLEEDIHADITMNAASGTLRAHKALLTASSPVLKRMLLDDDREEKSSVIVIKDVSLEACGALLNYLYGVVRQEVFLKHPVALLAAAKKHDLADLKECCEESLLEDLTSGNVLERLREAWIYQLDRLKKILRSCFTFLFDFGKIYDVGEGIYDFFRDANVVNSWSRCARRC
ncbi:unnamed protein product [Spirodela intermedia]|uniref:BTB domain-containing protein n=1 Tax=Spirodela intermedia TaxID=51605 RepID=A0ABN7EA81_SPIIN|nr:unnamed protein product [Spirodela intermedia]